MQRKRGTLVGIAAVASIIAAVRVGKLIRADGRTDVSHSLTFFLGNQDVCMHVIRGRGPNCAAEEEEEMNNSRERELPLCGSGKWSVVLILVE